MMHMDLLTLPNAYPMTVLVLDIGSSSARALLFDDQARLIPGAQVTQSYQIENEPTGAATLDMALLQRQVEACIDKILEHPAANKIRVVGVDTLVGNVLGVDKSGLPLTPVYTYADTRNAEDVEVLRASLDAAEMHQRTGCILHTAYQPARLHWLRRTQPALFQQAQQWLDIGTYFFRQWFGSAPVSYSVASWSGMLNRAALAWDDVWLDTLALSPDKLPPLADYNAMQQGLEQRYAARWPALRDIPFCLAVGDGVAANVGSGCVDRTSVALTVGTTAALRTITGNELPPVPAGLWSYRVNKMLHLIGGATSEGGNIFQWAQDTLNLIRPSEAELVLASREPDSHGLTFLPLLLGERSPGWAAEATGAIIGLRLSTTPLDILQAALEGVAHRLALIAEQLQHVTDDNCRITASGGAITASPLWAQIIANALNRPLNITAETELTARGTAILALHAIGLCSLKDYPPTVLSVIEPDAASVARMKAARERQVSLYQKLVDNR